MTRDQVALLLAKASAAFSNSAPNFERNPQIFNEYWEALKDFDARTAFENYERHRDTSDFFPSIASLKRMDETKTYHDQLRLQTADRFAQLEEWERNAVPIPKEIEERWGRK